LPEQLTAAYASIVTARVRLRELADDTPLPDEIEALAARMRRIAFTNEAFVSAFPDRENRASAAFVAGAAHHVSLMAARVGRMETQETRLALDSIAPAVSATLLFMIAEATADSAEMAKEIVIPAGDSIEACLISAIINLSKGNLLAICTSGLPNMVVPQSGTLADLGVAALFYMLLKAVRQLALELLGIDQTDYKLDSAAFAFRRVKDLCVEKIEINGESNLGVSTFPGPRHLASLLISVADNLALQRSLTLVLPVALNRNRGSL